MAEISWNGHLATENINQWAFNKITHRGTLWSDWNWSATFEQKIFCWTIQIANETQLFWWFRCQYSKIDTEMMNMSVSEIQDRQNVVVNVLLLCTNINPLINKFVLGTIHIYFYQSNASFHTAFTDILLTMYDSFPKVSLFALISTIIYK
jgi:hypothetical protein